VLLLLALLLLPRLAPASAEGDAAFAHCAAACRLSFPADLEGHQACVRECERKFPRAKTGCPELLNPCNEACRGRFGDQPKGAPMIACRGACMQRYGGLDCNPLPPPVEGGGGTGTSSRGEPLGAKSGAHAPALSVSFGEALPKRGAVKEGSGVSSSPDLGAASPSPAPAKVNDAAGPPLGAGGARSHASAHDGFAELFDATKEKRVDLRKLGALAPSNSLEAVVHEAVAGASKELTLFDRVRRRYREAVARGLVAAPY